MLNVLVGYMVARYAACLWVGCLYSIACLVVLVDTLLIVLLWRCIACVILGCGMLAIVLRRSCVCVVCLLPRLLRVCCLLVWFSICM